MPIDDEWEACWYCRKELAIERHHDFGGRNRKNSEKYGLVHMLGPKCHRTGPQNATDHPIGPIAMACKKDGQRNFEAEHGSREDFMRIFGKNYLD